MNGSVEAPGYCGITDGQWKYIWYPVGGKEQLFDLASDPHELVNLAGQAKHAVRQEKLKQELIHRHTERNSPAVKDGAWVEHPEPDESVADRRNQSWPGYHTEYYDVDVRH